MGQEETGVKSGKGREGKEKEKGRERKETGKGKRMFFTKCVLWINTVGCQQRLVLGNILRHTDFLTQIATITLLYQYSIWLTVLRGGRIIEVWRRHGVCLLYV